MTKEFNCYVGAVARTREFAEELVRAAFHDYPVELVHKEPPEDEEEQPTWVFSFLADSGLNDRTDLLHDHFDLPELPNLPYEAV